AWGVFRVAPWTPSPAATFPDTIGITSVANNDGGGTTISGYITPCPNRVTQPRTGRVVCEAGGYVANVSINGGTAAVRDGVWTQTMTRRTTEFRVTSAGGGVATWSAARVPQLAAHAGTPMPAALVKAPHRPKRLPRQ